MSNNDRDAVNAIARAYITATHEGDVEGFRKIFHTAIAMNGYLGEQLVIGNADMFLDQMANNPSLKSAEAPYKATVESLEVAGNIASVTLKETGFNGMSFTNYLHLLKEDGGWKIISKTFTTE